MKFDGRFLYSYSSAISSAVTSCQDEALRSYFTYLYPFICSKTCFYVSYTFTLLCHWLPKRLFLRLRQKVSCFDCFPGMTPSLAKCKQVFGCALLNVFTTICLFVCSSSICKWFDYIKETRQAIYTVFRKKHPNL